VLNSVAVLALVLLALQRGGGLVAIGVCQFVAGVIALVVARQLYARQQATTPLALTSGMVRHLWRGGVAIMSLSVVQAAQPYLDVLILSKLVPTDAIGYFGVARSIMGTLLAPAVILATATFPQLSRAARTPNRFGSVVRHALRPMMLFGALASVGTYLFAQTAVELIYGRQHFAPSVTILQLFSPVIFLLFVDVFLGPALVATNRSTPLAVIKVISITGQRGS
jgi:O-antigen/teichoic acid export membrane protein